MYLKFGEYIIQLLAWKLHGLRDYLRSTGKAHIKLGPTFIDLKMSENSYFLKLHFQK
jgi:hypothetical protein